MPIDTEVAIEEEDQWRVLTYRLLARLLAAAPDISLLKMLQSADIQPTETAINKAWFDLENIARQVDIKLIEQEYNILFIGFTSGEVIPYASRYLSGFLMEKPLAKLRQDLKNLGIHRQKSVYEPEDHLAALFEAMALLIEASDTQQWTFFGRHIQPWSQDFFTDLQQAGSANFYKPVGQLGSAFVELETNLISLEQTIDQ